MTKYEKIQSLIYKYLEEELKVISCPGNLWGQECYRVRKDLENQLNNLTLYEASEEI